MELNGWTSPQLLRRYGGSAWACSARARRSYNRVMWRLNTWTAVNTVLARD